MILAVILDAVGTVAAACFVSCAVVAGSLAGFSQRDTTLRRIAQATRFCQTATGLAAFNTIVHTVDIPNDGPLWPAIWLLSTAVTAKIAAEYRRRRDIKGADVVAEAERILGISPNGRRPGEGDADA